MLVDALRNLLGKPTLPSEVAAPLLRARPVTIDVSGNPTYAWQGGETLIADRNRAIVLKRIARLVGLPEEDFDRFYRAVASDFAEYVQLMPASEAHHHSRLGGLLDHSLDVAERALAIRRGYLLPPQRAPEIVARSADRWTYGVFLAALFHDVGKPAADLEVALYDHGGKSRGAWNPGAGPMPASSRYYIRYRDDRRYDQHQRAAAFIARSLLPEATLDWFSGDQELRSSLLSSLAGDYDAAGAIGVIVSQADGQSVAADLGGGEGIRLASSRKRPLSEMLMLALKQLFDDGRVHVNRPGAEAWVTGSDVWLVSKVGCDLLRDWLIEQGLTSVPKNNHRIFDELQQHKLCIPTEGDKAIWSVRIKAGKFDQRLTMLRFPIEAVWPDSDRRPAPLDGEIITSSPKDVPPDDRQSSDGSADKAPSLDVVEGGALSSSDACDDLSPSAKSLELSRDDQQLAQSAITPIKSGDRVDWAPIIADFFEWLAQGMTRDRFLLNVTRRNGDLWTVDEGLFLRTPGVIRTFATERQVKDYVALQRALERHDALLLNTRQPPTAAIRYKLDTEYKKLSGNVLTDPEQLLGIELPPPYPKIKRARGHGGHY